LTLEVYDLHKFFGNVIAVNNLSFVLKRGEVLGLLGQNGAGKTTTIKMLLGLLTPDKGVIMWDGKKLDRSSVSIGYLPEERGLYPKSKVIDQLRFFGQLEGMSKKSVDQSVNYWMEKLGMSNYKSMRANELSKGNQQKIQLIGTLLHNPEIVILDEPFSGLDPINASLLSSIIEEQIKLGKTVILSSHRMEQIEKFCKKICILKKGRVVLSGKLDEIKQNYSYRNFTLTASPETEEFIKKLGLPYKKEAAEIIIKVKNYDESIQLVNLFKQNSIPIRNFQVAEPSLNEIFIEKVK
jgi:ABC-2 type transport system ATP-binding protein